MLIDQEYILNVFRKIRNIKECHAQYSLNANFVPVSVDDLIWITCNMYEIHVVVKKVLVDLQTVRGTLLRFAGDKANPHVILARPRQSKCWLRYVVTKELSHLIIDEREDWCPDATIIIDEMFELFSLEKNGNWHTEPKRKVISEHIAEVVAIELLYPYERRAADRAKLSTDQTTYSQLEADYEIPSAIISRALTDSHEALCAGCWAELESERMLTN
jgi:hypothetical protein